MAEIKSVPPGATAYELRDQLPELASWMSDDKLKLLPIWRGTRFEPGIEYFDLNNPGRGPFTAEGDEGRPTGHSYVRRIDVPIAIWTELITWRQPIDASQGESLAVQAETLGDVAERSPAGTVNPTRPGDQT
jgi:hypothetical protein